MAYGDKRDYPKILIFVRKHYNGKTYFSHTASTTWSKTCKEAKEMYYIAKYPDIARDDIKCRFAKD